MNALTSPWGGRRVLVTGCTGFLGTAVMRELLDRGAIVAGLVRYRSGGVEFAQERDAKQFHVVHGRVEDALRLHSAMAIHEVSAIFHLAASDPFGNDLGTAAVLQAAMLYHSKVPVVMARPAGQLRLAMEDDSSRAPVGIARFGELFGGGDRKVFRVVPRTVMGMLGGDTAAVADGPTRDFVFVRDAARACLALAEAVGVEGASHDRTFRSGWEFSEREMANLVAHVFAGKSPLLPAPESAPNQFGWQAGISLANALGETIAWYRECHHRTKFTVNPPLQPKKAA
jgi:nucleoside-diphosphate-sugar epimerase